MDLELGHPRVLKKMRVGIINTGSRNHSQREFENLLLPYEKTYMGILGC